MMTQRYNKYPKKKSFKGNIFDYFTQTITLCVFYTMILVL